MFSYQHLVQFYETDLMGIVHHSNYLRLFEEARVAWAHSRGLLNYQNRESASRLAVLETWVRHIKPLQFGDRAEISLQAQLRGIQLVLEYQLRCRDKGDALFSVARTTHVAMGEDLKPKRPSMELKKIMESEKWNETWLLNL